MEVDVNVEFDAVRAALALLHKKLEQAPNEDWRAAIFFVALEKVIMTFDEAGFDHFDDLSRFDKPPEGFRHWRDDKSKYREMPF
jgi:hypothetical protein